MLKIFAIMAIPLLIGAGIVIFTVEANKYTSTNDFCSSCHVMARLASEPDFVQSAHMANSEGVHPSCGDCHISSGNIFVETYSHVVKGSKDLFSMLTNDFSDPKKWEAHRIKLAHLVREEMRGEDSANCRNCHDTPSIQPQTMAGRAAHKLLETQSVTCIDCHFNLVHAPVAPSLSFIRGSGLGVKKETNDLSIDKRH